jgi:hypothetical protein
MGTAIARIQIDIARLGSPAESEFGPIVGYLYISQKCIGSVHQNDNGDLIFIAGAATPLTAWSLYAIAEILDRWVN